jgi:hypothetical protein
MNREIYDAYIDTNSNQLGGELPFLWESSMVGPAAG